MLNFKFFLRFKSNLNPLITVVPALLLKPHYRIKEYFFKKHKRLVESFMYSIKMNKKTKTVTRATITLSIHKDEKLSN